MKNKNGMHGSTSNARSVEILDETTLLAVGGGRKRNGNEEAGHVVGKIIKAPVRIQRAIARNVWGGIRDFARAFGRA